MRICVPVETESGTESRVCEHFGRAPFLAVADTETDQIEIESSAECHDEEDHHIGRLKSKAVDAVVCRGLGRRAYAALRHVGIDVLLSRRDTVSEVVQDARESRLERLSPDRAGYGASRGPRGRNARGRWRHDARGARSIDSYRGQRWPRAYISQGARSGEVRHA